LAELGDTRAVEPLIRVLNFKAARFHPLVSARVRLSAAHALRVLGDRRAFEPLVLALKDADCGLRQAAAQSLGEFRDVRAVEPLIMALKDKDNDVRRNATQALGMLGDVRAIEPLISALKDKDVHIPAYAGDALVKLGGARAIEPLRALLYDEHGAVREWVARAVKKLSPNDDASLSSISPDVPKPAAAALPLTTTVPSVDSLTGIHNERYMKEFLTRELSCACRYRLPMSLAIAEIDSLSSLGERFGPAAGDFALQEVAIRLKSIPWKEKQLLARYGRHQFAVVMPETARNGSVQIAEHCRTHVKVYPFMFANQRLPLTIAVGVAVIMGDEFVSADEMIRRADENLRIARRSGNKVVCTATASKISRDQEKFLLGLFSATAVEKFNGNRKHEITFTDACSFWGISETLRGEALDSKMIAFHNDLDKLPGLLRAGDTELSNGRSISEKDIRHLSKVYEYLEEKFARHLSLLRSRSDR
jgi:diguanylate cyclase (GGDEF)-like protein